MSSATSPIGVFDTGIGGYTVVKALQTILPNEDLIYFGDGANTPYGNLSGEEILHLTRQILDFFATKEVKAVAVACNTISALIEFYRNDFPFPIFSIVEAGAAAIVTLAPQEAIVLSSAFTASTGCYASCVAELTEDIQVIAQGAPQLTTIIEYQNCDPQAIAQELTTSLGAASAAHPNCHTLVLGCTHYPLLMDFFAELYPQFTQVIDPAVSQAERIRSYLAEHNLSNPQEKGSFTVYTSGDCQRYRSMAEMVGLNAPDAVIHQSVATPLQK